MARAAGILTSRGGLASHAAVVARGWGIPAVVGAADLEVGDGEVAIGSRTLHAGDVITIDGDTGEVFEGAIAGKAEVVPEARTLLAWAEELGIGIGDGVRGGRGATVEPEPPRVARSRRTTVCAPSRSRASRRRRPSPMPSSRRRRTSSRSSTGWSGRASSRRPPAPTA